MNTNAYHELNLTKGAGETEIKAAFRRLAKEYHPDTSGNGPADAEKFRRAFQAYKELIAQAVTRKPDSSTQASPQASPASPTAYVFDSERRAGLDVLMDIALVRPAAGVPFDLVLPWTSHRACPRCLGRGQTLSRGSLESDLYKPRTCDKCHGTGSVDEGGRLSVTVTPEMAERGKIRLRGAGAYLPKQAARGDLIVSFRWVDRLPTGH
jgi:DnaJ-class molecular chaperone